MVQLAVGGRSVLVDDAATSHQPAPPDTTRIQRLVSATGPGAPPALPADMLQLQRLIGNGAVAETIKRSTPPPVTVQRHSSWEHAMLGDVNPKELGAAVDHDKVASGNRIHVLNEEKNRVEFFRSDAGADPRGRFPDIRWLQLKGSGLWLSYGEMDALADYLPDAATADHMTREQLVPVLQRMRQGIADRCREVLGKGDTSFKGAAWSSVSAVSDAAGEVKALQGATSQLGQDSYQGLLSRNACHFAPMSWQRWTEFHAQAQSEAKAHHDTGQAGAGNSLGTGAEEHERQAWLQNGYADHFLQDSFAAGHLVNKTLVMQWFAQYIREHMGEVGTAGHPDDDVLASMEDPRAAGQGQGGIAGRNLYGGPDFHTAADADRAGGTGVTDTQSAQERHTALGRVEGSGVVAEGGRSRAQNYGNYGQFLNSSYLQKASGAVHDWFNQRGVQVANQRGDSFEVGGDDTLLTKSDARGAETAGRAAHESQTAITELLASGATSYTPEKIFELVPRQVVAGGTSYPLESWNDAVLRQLCWTTIFPDVVSSLSGLAIRVFSDEMVDGGPTR